MKEIPLTKGKFTIVDDEDFERFNKFKWYCSHGTYAARWSKLVNGKRSEVYMHKEVIGAAKGQMVDHINGIGFDNRRENLRFATCHENQRNRWKTKLNKSGFKGVHKKTGCERWGAQLRINGKAMYLGCFKTPEEAAQAYDRAAIKSHGNFARLNFPISKKRESEPQERP